MSKISANAIFCDEIRQESNGKFFIIGIYAGDIIVNSFPAHFRISNYIIISGLSKGEHDFSVDVSMVVDGVATNIGKLEGSLNVEREDLGTVLAPTGLVVVANGPGKIILMLALDGEDAIEAGAIYVTDQPNLA